MYDYSNYDDYIIVGTNKSKLQFNRFSGIMDNSIWRELTNYERDFFIKKRLSMNVLKKYNEDKWIRYLPGLLDYKGRFYQHPISINNFVINSISEKKEMYNSEGILINISTYIDEEIIGYKIPWDEHEKMELINNIESIEFLAKKYVFDTDFVFPNINSIYAVCDIVNAINDLISIGYKIGDMQNKLSNYRPKDRFNIERIFKFCENLIYKSWSKTSSPVGKDGVISSGLIIENVPLDKYLIKLIEENTEFKLTEGNILKGYYESDSGYVCSEPYEESQIQGEEVKQLILIALIKNYNCEMDYAFSLLK
jgi:hypothetical protein